MRRRDIFNLVFNREMAAEPAVHMPDPVLVMPDYLDTTQTRASYKEWQAFSMPGYLLPEFSSKYPFTVTMELKGNNASLHIGVKNEAEEQMEMIELGLDNGYLFIDDLTDHRAVTSPKEKITLILTVNPQPGGASYAKLKAIDQYGLTLSTIKTTQYLSTDWSGAIIPSADLHALIVEGRQPIETVLPKDITKTT